jgi:hypothetical protein
MDDSEVEESIASRRPTQTLSAANKVDQVMIDSEDDISSGVDEDSDIDQKVPKIRKNNNNKIK